MIHPRLKISGIPHWCCRYVCAGGNNALSLLLICCAGATFHCRCLLLRSAGYAFCFASWNPPVLTEPDVVCPTGYEVTQQYGKPL
jgi:hypothetical protein